MRQILERLKTERLSRGWTLQDVSDRTHISITVLSALESGKTETLGSVLAVESMLRKYSAALQATAEQTGQKTTKRDEAQSGKSRYIMAGLLLIAVFAVAYWGRSFWQIRDATDSSQKAQATPGSQTETPPAAILENKTLSDEDLSGQHRELPEVKDQALESPPADVTEKSSATFEQDATPAGKPDETQAGSNRPPADVRRMHSLAIVADQKTWIQVIVDGKNVDTELLQAGETRKWQAMDRVNLVVGNGGGVRIQWDGKPVEISFKPGRVMRLTLPES